MAILIFNSIRGSEQEWTDAIAAELPDEEVRWAPDIGDPADIEFLIFGRPVFKDLPALPNLKLMMTMLAGVDALLGRDDLPKAPLTKTESPDGDAQMTEYCLLHVLRHHRQMPAYAVLQAAHEWKALPQPRVEERKVGFLGYGMLTKPMAAEVARLGFDVAAWARSAKPDAPIEVFHGADGLQPFLARTEIAVAMLPLTPDTKGILGAQAFGHLPEGAAVINLARGALVVNDDLIAALDSGRLAGATLDVTDPEPLPPESPLWDHPLVTIMPHVARRPGVEKTAAQAIDNIRRFRAGEELIGLVDLEAGY